MKEDWEKVKKTYGVKITHIRNNGVPVGTFIFREDNGVVCWGASFVNHKDNPDMNKGRYIAFQRYLKALNTGSPSFFIRADKTKKVVGNIDTKDKFEEIFNEYVEEKCFFTLPY